MSYQELGTFLRSRRERLLPAHVGLPPGFRRRTPGLRREEVAQLAGIGTTWYTWLEQGRDVSPSAEVLTALADALQLDPAERRHLFQLSGQPIPEPRVLAPERVEAPLLRMLKSLEGQPAYVLGRRWDVLAWNRAAQALFGDYGRLQDDERNIMHMVFANPAHRSLLLDWDQLAPAALAMFRADSARHLGDPAFARLIETLAQVSPEFRQWWPRHEVLRPFNGHKRIRHPAMGCMTFEYTSLQLGDQPGMKLVVYTPLDEGDTARKLQRLLEPS
ncbi:helix-turn-helix transcriptional regulator [Pseudomonas oryzihabitans]|uniref:Transcriptional regulator with XRE-family HTH domain n=1 Tax=Pseudomonas oryzihabitans TaxID=47885 RepID=A0AAJ2BSP9_9PSED|nr:helix-turn-helix transcriptional regulator [Pseudomonas psychrotolerans]MDR6232283.1 transcriptional regulator with XRE-family HTH domain [Pseudomonas psychrotolerans]MDR6353504.1 transcriptional regulator with XRE-family HTH domain [Pseudomonas psychrotolerans]